jgi:hypothetical protein
VLISAVAALAMCAACAEERPSQIALMAPLAPGKCREWVGQPIDRSCLPRIAMANRQLTLEIEEQCGACGTTAERCDVTVEGWTVTLSLDGKTCEPPAGAACREECSKNRVKCKIPPLAEGRYKVKYGDMSGHTDHIEVTSNGNGATSCVLDDPQPGG